MWALVAVAGCFYSRAMLSRVYHTLRRRIFKHVRESCWKSLRGGETQGHTSYAMRDGWASGATLTQETQFDSITVWTPVRLNHGVEACPLLMRVRSVSVSNPV